jgi:Domain of unknown function (DUF4145)
MATDMKTEDDKTKGSVIDVSCPECKHSTKHIVLHSTDIEGHQDMEQNEWYAWDTHYQIVQCKGCETISFRITSSNSEDMNQVGPDDWEPMETEELFPSRNEGRIQKYNSRYLPMNVFAIYRETIQAINGEQAILTGIGIRAIIEAICKDKNTNTANLQTKIDELVTMGVLTRDGADILHKLRVMGNKAAHEVKPHTKEQLGTALDVVEHLFEGVYVLPKKAKETFD